MYREAQKWLIFNAMVVAAFVLFSAFWTFEAPLRDVFPLGAPDVKDTYAEPERLQADSSEAGVVFRVPEILIAPQFSLFHGVITYADVEKMKPDFESLALHQLTNSRPQWFSWRLRLEFQVGSVPKSTGECGQTTLTLNDVLRSQHSSCRFVKAEGEPGRLQLFFSFDRAVLPGRYTASLQVWNPTLAASLNGIRTKTVASQSEFTHVFSANQKTLGQLILDMMAYDRSGAICLCLLIALILIYPLLTRQFSLSHRLLGLILIVAGAVNAVTPFFSGNDELAQVDYFFTANETMLNLPGDASAQMRTQFFASARNEVRWADFYQLHQVGVIAEGHCPHSIVLGGCGGSPEGMRFYRFVTPFVQALKANLGSSALDYLHWGRVINMLLFLGSLALVMILDERTRAGILALFLLAGAVFSLLPAVSNDFAVQVFSLAVLVFIFCMQNWKNWLAKVSSFAGAAFFSWLTILTDRVGVLILPQLIAATALISTYSFMGSRGGRTFSRSILPRNSVYLRIVTLTGVFVSIFGAGSAMIPWIAEKLAGSGFASGDLAALSAARLLDHPNFSEAILVNVKSFFGTYVWNHSYLNSGYYLVLFILVSVLWSAAILLRPKASRGQQILLTSYFALLVALHSAVLAAVVPRNENHFDWTFAVWRIYAPHIVGFGYLAVTGFGAILSYAEEHGKSFEVSNIFFLLFYLCSAYLVFSGYPQIFLADRY